MNAIKEIIHFMSICTSVKIMIIHSHLLNITHVATNVHVIARRSVVLTLIHDNGELV